MNDENIQISQESQLNSTLRLGNSTIIVKNRMANTTDGETENADLSKENTFCDIDCKSDDYCGGCLMSTYKTEYCVGTKCRNRTLYKCNVCGEKWWIYHD